MVPDGWSHGQVQDFLVLQRGFDLTQKNALPGKVPVYSSSGLSYFHSEAKVKGPGIVTGRKGSVGPVYFINEDFWPHDTTLWVKDFKGNDIHYIEYFLRFLRLEKFDEASSVPTLNRNNVHGVKCIFPPLIEQTRIAQILSTWDQAITATERLLENSQQRKKGLMQQLLTGKKRLPGFEGEWKSALLGELVEITTGSSKAQNIDKIGDKYIIDMGSVTRTGRLVPTKKTSLDGPYLAKGQLVMPKDDIGGGNIIGRAGVIPEDDKYLLADHVYALTPHETDSQFLGYLINSDKVNKSLRRKANGTAQLGLGRKDVQKQAVYIPSDSAEQKAIGEILLLADQEFDFLSKRLDKLKHEKKALMQQLLTGKRRVQLDTEAA